MPRIVERVPSAVRIILLAIFAFTSANVSGLEDWLILFDGQAPGQWSVTAFGGEGEVDFSGGRITLEPGATLTGITWSGPPLPRIDYEVSLEAMRVDGSDFFCGLTFPVGGADCSLIVGGWGGSLVGLSSLDGMDASENETTSTMKFTDGRWYSIRVRVTREKISAWIDEEQVVDADIRRRAIGIRPEVELSRPFGIASWKTRAALRNIRLRRLE